ncbi:MAG: adenine methyltransferase [Rickettsiales bacterium]|nr:adenine methyltransferase [Rickettsiales bacterium]
MSVHFSSQTDNWATPIEYFNNLSKLFNFTLDPCASASNAKAPKFFTVEQDGLAQCWETEGAVFLNPPYGRGISKWIAKAYQTALDGTPVVCLLPARTDTRWWRDYCSKGIVHFVSGRLKFGGAKYNAPFPCAIVIFANLDARAV